MAGRKEAIELLVHSRSRVLYNVFVQSIVLSTFLGGLRANFAMLRILGSANPWRRGVNRREVLRIGGVGALSLTLADLLGYQAAAASGSPSGSFGKAKRIVLLYLQG